MQNNKILYYCIIMETQTYIIMFIAVVIIVIFYLIVKKHTSCKRTMKNMNDVRDTRDGLDMDEFESTYRGHALEHFDVNLYTNTQNTQNTNTQNTQKKIDRDCPKIDLKTSKCDKWDDEIADFANMQYCDNNKECTICEMTHSDDRVIANLNLFEPRPSKTKCVVDDMDREHLEYVNNLMMRRPQ